MKAHDIYFGMSATSLVVSVLFQMFGIIYTTAYIPLGIFTTFLAWVFMIKAKKAIESEFRELDKIIGEGKS